MNDAIRTHALKTVHDYETLAEFEAAMIDFGRTLPPITSPTAKDPHYRYLCRGAARWVWERRSEVE